MSQESSCDVSTEIEITPAMVEAGLGAYDRYADVADVFELVRLVYIAMETMRLDLKA